MSFTYNFATGKLDYYQPILVQTDGVTITGDGSKEDPLIVTGQAPTAASQVVLFADLATTEPLNACTYYNGVANDGVGATLTGNVNGQLATISNPTKIDNVVTALDQVILVWVQNDQKQNGLYKVTQLGSGSLPFILTRSVDADQQDELYPIQVNTYQGQIYSNRSFLQKTIDPIIGTSKIVFSGSQIGISTAPIYYLDTVTSVSLPTCTYASGTNTQIPGIGATLTADVNGAIGTINGVTLTANMRILVKDQVNTAHNGDYYVTSVGSVSTKWKLTRLSAWGGEFVRYAREWKVNNSTSSKFGSRYSIDLGGLSNLNVGVSSLIFKEVYALPSVPPTTGQVLGYSAPGVAGWVAGLSTIRRHETTAAYDYLGYAAEGTSESTTTWKLTRLTLDSSGTSAVMRATDSWANRVTATYI